MFEQHWRNGIRIYTQSKSARILLFLQASEGEVVSSSTDSKESVVNDTLF